MLHVPVGLQTDLHRDSCWLRSESLNLLSVAIVASYLCLSPLVLASRKVRDACHWTA
jgi:hypothetical protein